MRIAVVTVVVAVCVAIGAYLYLHYIQPASVDTAVQTQPLPSPTSTTTPASQQAVTSASIPSAVPATAGTSAATSTVPSNAAQHPGMKLYRNDEYGFEFWYPEKWEVKENIYGNPDTKFDVVARPLDKNGKHIFPEPLVISVVTSNLIKEDYGNLDASVQPIVVGGKKGMQYEYIQDTHYKDITLLLNPDEFLIIGNDNDVYVIDFNTILSSFRFLK